MTTRLMTKLRGALPFITALLIAAPDAGASATTVLQIRPRSCMNEDVNEVCVDEVLVRWTLRGDTSACLWRQGDARALFCFNEAQGQRVLELAIRETTRFSLRDAAGEHVIASADLQVLRMSDGQWRRRYRHPWSLF